MSEFNHVTEARIEEMAEDGRCQWTVAIKYDAALGDFFAYMVDEHDDIIHAGTGSTVREAVRNLHVAYFHALRRPADEREVKDE